MFWLLAVPATGVVAALIGKHFKDGERDAHRRWSEQAEHVKEVAREERRAIDQQLSRATSLRAVSEVAAACAACARAEAQIIQAVADATTCLNGMEQIVDDITETILAANLDGGRRADPGRELVAADGEGSNVLGEFRHKVRADMRQLKAERGALETELAAINSRLITLIIGLQQNTLPAAQSAFLLAPASSLRMAGSWVCPRCWMKRMAPYCPDCEVAL